MVESKVPRSETVEQRYQKASEAERYYQHHGGDNGPSLRSRLETRFCAGVLKKYGPFESILDCPAGVGRFWEMLLQHTHRLFAADVSAPMIEKGQQLAPHLPLAGAYVAPAQNLPLPDAAVDAVFCHRLLHHFESPAVRETILKELARVTRRYVFFSAWSTQNLRSFRSRKKAERTGEQPTRFHLPIHQLGNEAEAVGLKVLGVYHKFRFWSPVVLFVARKPEP